MDVNRKKVLLTGATGGLGRSIARSLAAHGAHVVSSSRREAELKMLTARLPGTGHSYRVCDLAARGATVDLVRDVGEFDIFVSNAALPAAGRLDTFTVDAVERALQVNLLSPMSIARDVMPAWQRRGSGHFVFISSTIAYGASVGSPVYASAKYGLRGLALNLREDLRASGIGVSVVMPGVIRRDGMFADSGAPPLPLLGTSTPERVADAVLRAIRLDCGQVFAATLRQRIALVLGLHAPDRVRKYGMAAMSSTLEAMAAGLQHVR